MLQLVTFITPSGRVTETMDVLADSFQAEIANRAAAGWDMISMQSP